MRQFDIHIGACYQGRYKNGSPTCRKVVSIAPVRMGDEEQVTWLSWQPIQKVTFGARKTCSLKSFASWAGFQLTNESCQSDPVSPPACRRRAREWRAGSRARGRSTFSVDCPSTKKQGTFDYSDLQHGDCFSFPDGHDRHPCLVLDDTKILDLHSKMILDADEIDWDECVAVDLDIKVTVKPR